MAESTERDNIPQATVVPKKRQRTPLRLRFVLATGRLSCARQRDHQRADLIQRRVEEVFTRL